MNLISSFNGTLLVCCVCWCSIGSGDVLHCFLVLIKRCNHFLFLSATNDQLAILVWSINATMNMNQHLYCACLCVTSAAFPDACRSLPHGIVYKPWPGSGNKKHPLLIHLQSSGPAMRADVLGRCCCTTVGHLVGLASSCAAAGSALKGMNTEAKNRRWLDYSNWSYKTFSVPEGSDSWREIGMKLWDLFFFCLRLLLFPCGH